MSAVRGGRQRLFQRLGDAAKFETERFPTNVLGHFNLVEFGFVFLSLCGILFSK